MQIDYLQVDHQCVGHCTHMLDEDETSATVLLVDFAVLSSHQTEASALLRYVLSQYPWHHRVRCSAECKTGAASLLVMLGYACESGTVYRTPSEDAAGDDGSDPERHLQDIPISSLAIQ